MPVGLQDELLVQLGMKTVQGLSSTWIAHQNGNSHMQHLAGQMQTQISA